MMYPETWSPVSPNQPRGAQAQARALVEAMAAVEAAVANQQPADAALSAFFRTRRHLGSRDRRLIANAVFAAFRWRGWVGSLREGGPRMLAAAARVDSAAPLPPALQALASDLPSAVPPDAAPLDSSATEEGHALDAARCRAERLLGRPCDIRALVPGWFGEWIEASGDPDGAPPDWMIRFIASTRVRPPLWLRALGSDSGRAAALLREHGQSAEALDALPGAVRVDGAAPYETLFRPVGIRAYAQDLASQRMVRACRATPGQRWWDACAGGGGKTLGLLDAVGPRGSVWATDVRPASLRNLAARAASLKLPAPSIRTLDAAGNAPVEEAFDGILVDAPCTGSGTWARNPDAPWRIGPGRAQERIPQQQAILDRVARALHTGGRLVYATCAIGRPENDDQTVRFLRQHPDYRLESAETLWPWDGPQNESYVAVFVRISCAVTRRPSGSGCP